MTKKVYNVKNIFFASLLILCTLFSTLVGTLFLFNPIKTINAQTIYSEVSIKNNDFDEDTITGEIKNATGWTKLNNSNFVTSGIISLQQDIFSKQMSESYKLTFRPYPYSNRYDDQVLMINSQDEILNSGYQSPSFTLNSGCFYKITFKALTENTDTRTALASANLFSSSLDELSDKFISIVTSGDWLDYTILVEASTIKDIDASLQFWLGYSNGTKSYGSVFFDKVTIHQIDQTSFSNLVRDNRNDSQTQIISLKETLNDEQFTNNDFENSKLNGFTSLANNSSSVIDSNNYNGLYRFDNPQYEDYKLSSIIGDANLASNTQALIINNIKASSIGYKSTDITIKENQTYKISFYAYADISSGTANAKLTDSTGRTFSLEIANTSGSTALNNWKIYSFYIQGDCFKNVTANLEFWLGENETAVGHLLIDRILVYKVSSNEYDSASSDNEKQVDLGSTSELTIKNGLFNDVDNQVITESYPYGVKDWTNSTTLDNKTLSGMINTKDMSSLNGVLQISPTNSYSANNNVLMIGNVGKNAQKYTTNSTISLTNNSYYKLSFKVQTQALTNNAKAGFKLYTNSMTLKELMQIESDGVWTTYSIYIHTGLNSYSAYVELSLGEYDNGTGYVFFDDVILSTSTKDAFDKSNNTNSYRVNLETDEFTNTLNNSQNGLYTSNSYSTTNNSNIDTSDLKAGIVSLVDDTFENQLVGITNPYLPQGALGNAIFIKADEDCYYSFTSNEKFTLSSGSYYKISVWVNTANLSQKEENAQKNDSTSSNYPYGATVSLTQINKEFSGIDTNGKWKQYTFYINTTDDAEIQVKLSLGNSNALTSGTVFFTNVIVENIEQDSYYASVAPLETDTDIDNIMAVGSTEVEEQDTDDTTPSEISFDWLIIPTLVTAIALIFAVIAVGIRHFVKKHPRNIKVKKQQYSRDVSLEKDFEHREAIRKQQEKLEKLKQSLENVRFEIADSRQAFKKDKAEYEKHITRQIKFKKATNEAKQAYFSKEDKKKNAAAFKEEIKKYKREQKQIFEQEKLNNYLLRQEQLKQKFMAIELEIEQIYQEELRLIKEYKDYKKQVALKRKELRLERKNKKSEIKSDKDESK